MTRTYLRPKGWLHVFLVFLWMVGLPVSAISSVLPEEESGQKQSNEQISQFPSIADLYRSIGNEPIWISGQDLSDRAREFLSFLSGIETEGLAPEKYLRNEILTLSAREHHEQAALWRLEYLLDQAFLRLASDLIQGEADWERHDPRWHIPRNPVGLEHLVSLLHSGRRLDESLQSLNPSHDPYLRLRNALHKYQEIVSGGGWEVIESAIDLKPGVEHPAVGVLRDRLVLVGDIENAEALNPNLFDERLAVAVKRFQARHRLKQDGVVGRDTKAALNVSAGERLRQIKINLDRWRWMPRELGKEYIMVNTAAFSLDYVRDNKTMINMRVIVGDQKHHTPVFTKPLTYVDINPVWNVPPIIVNEEILPQLAMKPDYLEQNRFRILSDWSLDAKELTLEETGWSAGRKADFPYRIQQASGEGNALGRIKFMLPNQYSIYLHDTPGKTLFNKESRTFSHGCIRIENPKGLALALFEQLKDWDEERLDEALASEDKVRVIINNPVPVYIVYFSSWVDDTGAIYFSPDPYRRDAPLIRQLFPK